MEKKVPRCCFVSKARRPTSAAVQLISRSSRCRSLPLHIIPCLFLSRLVASPCRPVSFRISSCASRLCSFPGPRSAAPGRLQSSPDHCVPALVHSISFLCLSHARELESCHFHFPSDQLISHSRPIFSASLHVRCLASPVLAVSFRGKSFLEHVQSILFRFRGAAFSSIPIPIALALFRSPPNPVCSYLIQRGLFSVLFCLSSQIRIISIISTPQPFIS